MKKKLLKQLVTAVLLDIFCFLSILFFIYGITTGMLRGSYSFLSMVPILALFIFVFLFLLQFSVFLYKEYKKKK